MDQISTILSEAEEITVVYANILGKATLKGGSNIHVYLYVFAILKREKLRKLPRFESGDVNIFTLS